MSRHSIRRLGWRVVIYGAFLIFAFLALLPVYFILMSSFSPPAHLLRTPPEYVPGAFTFDNYRRLVDAFPFTSYLTNSVIFASGSAALSVVVSYAAAYAFARLAFHGRNVLFAFFMLSTALPQISTVIPLFRLYNSLGLNNTLHGLILLMGSLLAPFTIWLLTAFIRQVPKEVIEAAQMDGARLVAVMLRIVVPLTMPAIVTLFVIDFIITWNELFYPLVFASGVDAKPLTLGLVELTTGVGTGAGRPWDLMSALSMVMIVPPVLLVIAFQRLIVRGLTAGAVNY